MDSKVVIMKKGSLIRLKDSFRICLLYDKARFDQAIQKTNKGLALEIGRVYFEQYNCAQPPVMYLGKSSYEEGKIYFTDQNAKVPYLHTLKMVLHNGKVWYHAAHESKYTLDDIFEIEPCTN